MGDDEAPPRRTRPATPEEEALRTLDLAPGATPAQIKARYKELAKRHHPDANGGDKAAEERLKSINQAYTLLKSQAFGVRQAPSR
jgi:DnaJ-class molecular chaperone